MPLYQIKDVPWLYQLFNQEVRNKLLPAPHQHRLQNPLRRKRQAKARLKKRVKPEKARKST
jgi:hypothetical protein